MKPELTHFLEKVRENPSLKARLQERPEELMAVAEELGFQLKIEDFQQASTDASASLSDAELEQLSGGGCFLGSLTRADWCATGKAGC